MESGSYTRQHSFMCFNATNIRFLVLIIISLITLIYSSGNIMVSPLQSVVERSLGISILQFEILFSAYTLASAVSCLLGGVVTDKYLGIRAGSVGFGCLALVGEALVAGGGLLRSYWWMLGGRLFLGAGSECLAVLLNCYAVVWFQERELGFVFGFFLMFGKGFGTSLAFLLAAPFYHLSQKYFPPNLVLGASMSPYLILMILLVVLTSLLAKISTAFGKNLQDPKLLHTIDLKKILSFKLDFWIFNLMLSFCTVSVTSFVPCSQELLVHKFSISPGDANNLSTIFNLITGLFTPLPGYLAGRTGYSLYYDLFATVIGIAALIVFLWTSSYPYVPIILYALYYSIINSSTWNLVALMVDDYQLATAYGTISVTLHLLTTVTNLACGYLLQRYGSMAVFLLLLAYVVIGLILLTFLIYIDRTKKGLLNLSSSEKEMREEEISDHVKIKQTPRSSPKIAESQTNIKKNYDDSDFYIKQSTII